MSSTVVDDSVDPADLTSALLAAEAERAPDPEPREVVELPDEALPGVGGEGLGLRASLAAGGAGLLVVLSLLNLLDYAGSAALSVLGPDVQRSLGLSDTGLGVLASLAGLTFVLGAIPLGVLGDRVRRTRLTAACAAVAAVATAATGSVQAVWQLAAARLVTGAGQASILPVNNSLLADGYPVRGRSSVFAVHNLMPPLGYVAGPLLAGGVAALAGGPEGWRTAFLVLGLLSLVTAGAALLLREPPRGRGDLAAVVGEDEADRLQAERLGDPPVALGPGVQRLLAIRTLYFLLVGVGVLGFSLVSVPTYFGLLLEREYGLDALERGYAVALTEAISLAGVVYGGVLGARLFRQSPPRAVLLVAAGSALFAVALPLALYAPGGLPVLLVGIGIAKLLQSIGTVPIYVFVAAVVPVRLRTLGYALLGIYILLLGGLLGNVITGLVSDERGPRFALVVVSVPASVAAALLTAYGARFVRADLSRTVEEVREEQAERERVRSGGEVPVLQVRNLDAGYGSVQVLFGVDLDVREGEVLALLGTNGAGKSTLLRAISGLLTPTRGVIRLDGRQVTFTDAPTRVGLGVVQVPGGKAVFPSLTVAENLLAGAHRYGWDRDRIAARVDDVVTLLPRLGERFDQRAGSLSGGEQQMLAIGKALLLEPRLLLIDELSLGLAPVVVQDLLEVVEVLKARGVTMVLVEQSLNVALSVADRAVFMEKGRVRFTGPAAELLERPDLARAVFLGGTS
jgi:ABC-type branched-subunit amino acid transport system ATPase component/sugar phosphate permease